jgi:hypothetical protein
MLRFGVNLLIYSVPALLAGVWAVRLSRASRDEWKIFVWLPVAPLGWWAFVMARDVTRDPTSHNLWPFELVAVASLSLALFGVVLVARRFAASTYDFRTRTRHDSTRD